MFTVSTQIRYALRALARIAGRNNRAVVTLGTVSKSEGISRKYLENIFKQLKKAGIVRSERGPFGGYSLARSPSEITLHDLVVAIDGPVTAVSCLKDEDSCDRNEVCTTKPVWREFQDTIVRFLSSKTLDSVLEVPDSLKEDT